MMWRLAFWWHGWRYRRQARHLASGTETELDMIRRARAECEPDFYGSMTLAGERGWQAAPEVAHSGWWGQTAADLAPEALALDSGPGGCSELLPGPDPIGWPHAGGPVRLPKEWSGQVIEFSSEAELVAHLESRGWFDPDVQERMAEPGPDTTRLAWLDQQLDAHAVWARRMRGQVTGWSLEGAAA